MWLLLALAASSTTTVELKGSGITYYLPPSDSLCVAPCTTSLKEKSHRFALSAPGGEPILVRQPVEIHGPTALEGAVTSQQSKRTWGTVLAVTGFVLSGATIAYALISVESGSGTDEAYVLAASAVIPGLAAGILGVIWAGTDDQATITARPSP